MKALKSLLGIALATLLFAGCNPEDLVNNSITFDGKTYTDMDVYYRIENQHFFFLLVDIHADIEIHGAGQVDTPAAFGEDLKGNTVNFDSETLIGAGYGDVIAMYFYGDNYDYSMEPSKGTQVTKKIDDTHYSIKMDMTDGNGKPFKLDVVAAKANDDFQENK
ncbi:MAG: hypothetical protein K6E61_07495 [Bacteroidales bacterium]|nr:hypothetical protein [Bacteroidales bacterium]